MRDKVSIERVKKLHPKVRDEVVILIDKAESRLPRYVAIRVVQGLRTFKEQDALYAQGRTKPGDRVTNSKAGQSYHNYGLAIDFAFVIDKDQNGSFESLSWDLLADLDRDGEADWLEVVDVFEEAGWTWGGRFTSLKDNPHLERTFGFNWRMLLALFNAKKLKDGYVNI
jgi:peptidoglycan LD-endopeptidase CwlK